MSDESPLKTLKFGTFLADAINYIIERKKANKPMVASYTVPCTCDDKNCTLKYAVTVVPFTYAAYTKDGMRTIQ